MMPLSARQAAAKLLSELDFSKINASDFLDVYLDKTGGKRLLTELVYGVIRNVKMLDTVIAKTSSVRAAQCRPFVMSLLRCGCYEMLFCSGQPAYATVNETVKLAGKKNERGFINAVLRNIYRNIDCFVSRQDNLQISERCVPVGIELSVVFKREIFPDPDKDEAGWISCVFSLPRFAVENWIEDYGFNSTLDIALGLNRRPSIYLRANRLKTNAESLLGLLRAKGIDADRVNYTQKCEACFGDFVSVNSPGRVSSLPGFAEGLFSVQDLTAGRVACTVNPHEDDVVVDLCAAPGTKTTHLAELMGGKGRILASDINPERAHKIISAADRLGLKNIEVIEYQRLVSLVPKLKPAVVLLDVPCSNTGVMARRVELRHRLTEHDIKSLAKTQLNILDNIAAVLSGGSKICYSTCSISKIENRGVIEQFITKNANWRVVKESLTLPSGLSPYFDGGYVAILSP
jgi:16S rRNA (cytosine967-C5)-methyltransferase